MSELALGIIDAQRGFMPAETDGQPQLQGFGELPVADGAHIIAPLNRLVKVYGTPDRYIFTTQDWHPHETAHFSDQPDYQTNWPVHCMANTPGAELHPDLVVPTKTARFLKGDEPLARGEDDTSYSGYYAHDRLTGKSLAEWLDSYNIGHVLLGGLALDYCVGKTALDLRQRVGVEVTVALDATRGISPQSTDAMLQAFEASGVQLTTTDEWVRTLSEA